MRHKYSLKDYSLFAGIILCSEYRNSQIIYTDLEPDIIVSDLDQVIDMDNDGFDDFRFIRESLANSIATLYNCYSSIFFEVNCINTNNSLVGNSRTSLKDIVYPFSSDYLINSEVQLTGDIWQYLTYKLRDLSCLYHEPIGPWMYPDIGNWASHKEEDQFIGVKFKNIESNCFYYGWIRCQISDSLDELTIKDYAYNSICGEGIFTGTLISPIINNDPEFTIQCVDNQLSINIPEEYLNFDCNLYSISGALVISIKLENINTILDLNLLPSGYYVINLKNEKVSYSKKSMWYINQN